MYRVTAALTGLFLFGADESGCEADMAEGSVEEDSGDMLGPTAAPILQTPAPSNMSIKDEVSGVVVCDIVHLLFIKCVER